MLEDFEIILTWFWNKQIGKLRNKVQGMKHFVADIMNRRIWGFLSKFSKLSDWYHLKVLSKLHLHTLLRRFIKTATICPAKHWKPVFLYHDSDTHIMCMYMYMLYLGLCNRNLKTNISTWVTNINRQNCTYFYLFKLQHSIYILVTVNHWWSCTLD